MSEDEEDGEGVGMSPGRDGGMKSRRVLLEVSRAVVGGVRRTWEG